MKLPFGFIFFRRYNKLLEAFDSMYELLIVNVCDILFDTYELVIINSY